MSYFCLLAFQCDSSPYRQTQHPGAVVGETNAIRVPAMDHRTGTPGGTAPVMLGLPLKTAVLVKVVVPVVTVTLPVSAPPGTPTEKCNGSVGNGEGVPPVR
jgi:hypothetical protein